MTLEIKVDAALYAWRERFRHDNNRWPVFGKDYDERFVIWFGSSPLDDSGDLAGEAQLPRLPRHYFV